MKYKAQIIGFCVLCAVAGGFFAAWQFHLKEIFEGYREDDRLRETLEGTFNQLQEAFNGYKPELLIDEWQSKMQPWRNAREERSTFFNLGDWYDVEAVPEEARMLKFWFTDISNAMLQEAYLKIFEKTGAYDTFPTDIRSLFDVAKEEDWAGRDVSKQEVEQNLRRLNWGISLINFLLEANVSRVSAINMWPRRVPGEFNNLLGLQTVGLRVSVPAREWVRFAESLRQESRYFTIDAIKISYPYIAYNVEPQLDVRFLLTQANYRAPADEQERTVVAAAGAPGRGVGVHGLQPLPREGAGRRRAVDVEEGTLQRFWRWFKRTVFAMN